ncbi:translation initiation factor IF-2-like [Mauremys reevesii]|uniref:translation initiation factor IF-2-like n=1 Tax=Mauremys reevesii TaxID=260615 RepID=UPI00193EE6B1|nr:translation initiation factor IF-2-like [Mauremys reevesii]
MNLRPQLMRLSSTKDSASANILEEATSMLEQKDRDLANIIRGIYSQTEEPQERLQRALQHMLQPAISTIFVALPPWSYLHRVPVPPRTSPQDRRQARAEREMLQRQHMERLKQEERLQRFREEEQKRQQEGKLLLLLEETKGTFEAQRVYLEEQLSQEKQLRYEIQRKAEAQISGLQAEIKRLMEKRLSIDAYSEGSLIAPAPSLQSLTPSQMLHPQPSPVQPPPPTVTDGTNRTREIHGKAAKTITLDLLEQLMQAANTIANGSNAAEQDSLNAATKEHLRNYNQDCKNAEKTEKAFQNPKDN